MFGTKLCNAAFSAHVFKTPQGLNCSTKGCCFVQHDVDVAYENVRKKVAKFINCDSNEVVFTSGASASLNTVVYGLEEFLNEGDEVLLTKKKKVAVPGEMETLILTEEKIASSQGVIKVWLEEEGI